MKQNLLFNQASALGKRLAMVLTMLLSIGIGSAWGATATFTATQSGGWTTTAGAQSGTIDGVTLAVTNGIINGTQLRCYSGATMTISSTNNITEIAVTCTGTGTSNYSPSKFSLSNSTGSYDYSGTIGTWKGSSTSVSLQASAQVRMTQIVVTYESATPKQDYTLSYQAGENSGTLQVEEGANLLDALGELETPTSCDATSTTFVGWTATEITEKTNTAPMFITSTDVMPSADYAVFAVFAENSGGASFDGTTGGNFKIYAIVKGTKYYAKGTGSKISSTTEESNATEYTFAKTSTGFTIKTGTSYITYSSSTNLGTNTTAYNWNISEGTNGSWRITSTANTSRGIIFRASTYNQFGGYSVGNASAGSTEYFDVEIGSSPSFSNYITSCSTETLVSLNPNGGTIDSDTQEIQTENGTLTLPEPTRDCYTFTNWNTKENGTGESFAAGEIADWDSENTTLYAQWTQNTYTITWKNGDAVLETDNNVLCGAIPTYDGAIPTKTATAQYTYSFNGWNPEIYAANKDQVYTAQFASTTRQYTVTFDANGHGSAPANQKVDYGTKATEPTAPTAFGYTFGGWYKEAECTNVWDFATDVVTSNITLYAQWTEKALTDYRTFCDVVCDAYSFHTGSDDDREEWLKEAIKCFVEAEGGFEHEWQIKDYIIPEDDKFFVGNYGYFYNDNLGIGANGKSRSVVSDWGNMYLAPAMDENDASGTPRLGHAKGAKGTLRIFDDSNWDNLFVGFIPDGYKLKFGDEEYTFAKTSGSEYRSEVVQYNSTTVDNNVSVGVVDADGNYVATNHTQEMRHIFLEVSKPLDGGSWADANAKFAIYYWNNSTNGWCGFLKNVPSETTLYEGWVPADATGFKFVRYNSNQSAPGSWDNDKAWNQTGDLTFQQVQENGNLFTITDWGTGTWSTYEKYGQFAMHDNSKSKNWYVHFVPHYVLTYDKNADDATGEMGIQTVAVDATDKDVPVASCGFTRVGYDFKNWRKDETSTYYNAGVNIELSADITLYAQWTAKEITIIWDANGGSVDPESSSYTYNGTSVELPTPTRANYIFNGWFTAATGGTKITEVGTNNKPTEDVTYYAQWTEKATPTFAWSAATCTAALEADNTFPTLNNTNNLPVTYSSSRPDIAKIDENGDVILGAVGETEITATGAETATHKSATTTYKLTVVESNCRWVEVTDNTTLEDGDEVVISMTLPSGTSYVLPNEEATNKVPEAIKITNTTLFANDYIWIIGKNGNNLTFESYKNSGKFLTCNNADAGVRVNTDTKMTFVIDDTYGYLKNTQTTMPRYLGVHNEKIEWYSYTLTDAGNFPLKIAGQTLKFYKRECLDSEHYWVTWNAGEGTWTDGSSNKLESYQVGAPITKPTENPTRVGYEFVGWDPNPTTMPAQNTTFTAQWTEVYKITWYENGVPSYTYVPSDNPIVTWEDDIADCGEKKFYGWTADDTFVSDPTTPPTCIEKGIRIAGDVTYYAVYADATEPANPGYEKVTTISEGTYLIATDATTGMAYTGKSGSNNYGGYCAVEEIENDVISEKPDAAVEVTVASNGSNFYMHDGTYYLGYTSGNAMTFDTSIQTGNQNIWKLTTEGYIESVNVTGRILQYNSGSPRFACYTGTQKYAYLYKKQTTTYTNFAVSCATYDISVTTPTGGTVTTTPADEAGAGQTITVNVTPADCKYLTALKYNDGSDHSINISSTPYTFTMPAADVTVTATFADKTATDIEILTSAHRNLMQGSAFVGEQIKVTYDNGETETLDWDDTRLTFSGYNMATLGTYTVRVDYNDCGTANTSYSIEVIDGIAITFIDAGISETIKYELNAHVDVETKTGQYACSGHEFVGWSETEFPLSDVPNMRTSEEYVPVRNFNATTSRTLYAVYSILKKQGWVSIEDANHIRSGAEYMIVKNRYGTYSALSTTTSTYNANYRAATILDKDEDDSTGNMIVWRRTSDNTDFQIYTGTATNDVKWLLIKKDNKNYLYNQTEKKYLQVTTTAITLTSEMADNFKITDESGDCCLNIQSATSNYYISGYNSSNNYYFQPYSTETDANYLLTRDSLFTTTPPCSPLYATFYGNGGIVTDGIKSGDYLTIKEPTRDAGITTPTASFADCNGKTWTFVGWAREEIDVTRIPVLTTDLLHDGGGNKHYNIEKNGEEFWAVYTNTGDPETKYGTITLTVADFDFNSYQTGRLTKEVLGDSYIIDYKDVGCPSGSGNGIQIAQMSEKNGYIMNTTSLGKINSIKFTNFEQGDIDDIRVYVGNTPDDITTLLTVEELQTVGDASTYYPNKNYSYFKIQSNKYTGIETISIDFGKGTQIWATTPDCSTITLSGDNVYVTSTNGQSIRAMEKLTVKAVQLESKAKVVISSNSSDIYFSDVQDANFTQAVKPTKTLTLTTDVDGNLSATEIYVHYRPSVDGTGIPEDVVVSANLETPNPSITDDHTIHVRNLPTDFVIAAKVNDIWYALPNNCNSTSIVNGLPIDVDNEENPSIATFAPAEAKWGLKHVYTTSGVNDRYGDFGEYFVFAETNTGNAGLLYSNKDNAQVQTQGTYSGISGYTEIPRYEWIPTTTDLTTYQLASAADSKLLSINVNGVFGTHSQLVAENKLRLLPIEEISQHAEMQVVEWREDAVVFMYTGNPTHKVTTTLASTSTTKPLSEIKFDHGVYKMPLSNLLNNEGKSMSIRFYDGSEEVARTEIDVPVIVNSEMNTSSLSTMAKADYETCDVVILNGGKLTASETSGGSQYRFRNVTIYGGGKLVIGEGKYLSMASIILRAGGFANDGTYEYVYPQFELKGTLSNSAGEFKYDYITDNEHWYHLVLPFDGKIKSPSIKYPVEFYGSNVATTNTGSWIVKRYDGATRSTGNYNAWVDIETEGAESITAGKGYIYWGAPKKVTVNGDPQRQKWGIQRIVMSKGADKATEAENANKTIAGLGSYESDNVNDQGWNLIGNPYMVDLTGLNSNSLKTGKLIEVRDDNDNWTGGWELDSIDAKLRYITVPSDHFEWYEAKRVSKDLTLDAGRAFFVQINSGSDGVEFEASNRVQLMPALRTANNNSVDIETGIVLSNETLQDEVNFWIKDGKTNDYEYNADYPKTPNNNQFNIYGVHTNGDLSWVAISPEIAAESMPIGYQVPAAGTYMLSVSEEYYSDEVDALLVTDHEMSPEVTTDLMITSYEFSVNQAETNNKRFTVAIKLKNGDNNDATGLDNLGIGNEHLMKFIYQDKIYILHHGVIYDATGKRVITINK